MSDATNSLIGTAVGLVGVGLALHLYKKITGKDVDDGLIVKNKGGEKW